MRILSSTSKPISSPGRTEKFPPPLMRFLRSNVGSRSRGRTKSNPLFMRRKKAITSSSNGNETQEPSSPKVTCIGQVRVRRSRSSKSRGKIANNNDITKDSKSPRKNCSCSCCCCRCSCCCWFQKPTFCGLRIWRKPSFSNCVLFFNCRSVRVQTDSSKYGSNRFEPSVETSMITRTTTTTTTTHTSMTPPKNALLLTRCKSAPYRSSSLVCQIWAEKTEDEVENRALGIELSRSSSESSSRDSTSKSRGNQDIGSCARITFLKEDFGNSADFEPENNCCTDNTGSNSKEVEKKDAKNDDDDDDGISVGKPLMLMRSKSEPARSDTEKLDPESIEFWRHRRSTPHLQAEADADADTAD